MVRSVGETPELLSLDEFPPHTYAEWKDAAEKLLKGAPFEKCLVAATDEGFSLQPLYRREDLASLLHLGSLPGEGNLHRGTQATTYKQTPWIVAQEAPWTDPETFNRGIRRDVEKGVNEICCQIGGSGGLNIQSLSDLEVALKDVDLEKTRISFAAGKDAFTFAALLFAYLDKTGVDPKTVSGCLGCDPLGVLAKEGELNYSLEKEFEHAALLTCYVNEGAKSVRPLLVSGLPYADGGCSSSQEVAYVLATGVEYLRRLEAAGFEPSQAAGKMQFSLSMGPHFFMEIAKLRAARILWSRIVESLGGGEKTRKMLIHCRTGTTNKTLYDRHSNLLRTCTEALSAVLGGCNSLTIAPFDELNPDPEGPARRLARNIHFILAEECSLNRVVDPGGGSYYLENLTDMVARKAWEVFQSIEEAGGMTEAIIQGIPQANTIAKAEDKRKKVASRRTKIVGTNFYPNPKDSTTAAKTDSPTSASGNPGQKISLEGPDWFAAAVTAAGKSASLGQLTAALKSVETQAGATAQAIRPFRLAEDYEGLRLAAEAYKIKHGHPPQILQINLGPSRRYRLRADWTSSFFQVGGFEVMNDRDFGDEAEALEAVIQSEIQLAIITSDDVTNQEKAAGLATALKNKSPQMKLLLAGAPGEKEATWRAAGIDDFIHIRSNNYETLRSLLQEMGVNL